MMTRTQVTAFLGLALVYWIALLALRDVPLSWEMLVPFSGVVGAVSLSLLIFDLWAWHLPIIQGSLIKRPNLNGTWKTELQSDWIDPATGKTVGSIDCFIVIRQTASDLSIRLITPESKSETVSAGIEVCRDGSFEISCTYRNKPRSEFRHRSQVHYGAMLLNADGRRPSVLEGEYWTDRNTTGQLKLSYRKRGRPMTYEEASALYD